MSAPEQKAMPGANAEPIPMLRAVPELRADLAVDAAQRVLTGHLFNASNIEPRSVADAMADAVRYSGLPKKLFGSALKCLIDGFTSSFAGSSSEYNRSHYKQGKFLPQRTMHARIRDLIDGRAWLDPNEDELGEQSRHLLYEFGLAVRASNSQGDYDEIFSALKSIKAIADMATE